MSTRFRPDPAEFERCVSQLCIRIETIAMREGLSHADCGDLERTFSAMPPLVRERVKLMLDGIHIQTEFEQPPMAFAARYLLRLADNIWEQNPHPLTHSAGSRQTILKRR
jgi:hypothetical protein